MAVDDTLALQPKCLQMLGAYYVTWSSTDLALDCAIGRILRTTNEEALILTSGMQLGSKARLLFEVVKRGDHKNKSVILGAINHLRNKAKRSVLAHCYMVSKKDSVAFITRSGGQDFKVDTPEFTEDEFKSFLAAFAKAGEELQTAVGITNPELVRFGNSLKLANKSTTSPKPPSAKAQS